MEVEPQEPQPRVREGSRWKSVRWGEGSEWRCCSVSGGGAHGAGRRPGSWEGQLARLKQRNHPTPLRQANKAPGLTVDVSDGALGGGRVDQHAHLQGGATQGRVRAKELCVSIWPGRPQARRGRQASQLQPTGRPASSPCPAHRLHGLAELLHVLAVQRGGVCGGRERRAARSEQARQSWPCRRFASRGAKGGGAGHAHGHKQAWQAKQPRAQHSHSTEVWPAPNSMTCAPCGGGHGQGQRSSPNVVMHQP